MGMPKLWKYVGLALVGGAAAAQQPTVDIYTNVSFDSQITTAYATGVMQVDMANIAYCNLHPYLCDGATHTYHQTVTIKSPSGRTGSCSFNSQYPAMTPVNLQCEADLGINGELGAFSLQTAQNASCTVAGTFLASLWNGFFNFNNSVTEYYNRGEVSGGWVYTYYPNTASCNCTCRAPDDITRSSSYPYWQIVIGWTSFLGVVDCASKPPYNADHGMYGPTACGG